MGIAARGVVHMLAAHIAVGVERHIGELAHHTAAAVVVRTPVARIVVEEALHILVEGELDRMHLAHSQIEDTVEVAARRIPAEELGSRNFVEEERHIEELVRHTAEVELVRTGVVEEDRRIELVERRKVVDHMAVEGNVQAAERRTDCSPG